MRHPLALAASLGLLLAAPALDAQAIIAQSQGLPSPQHVIDFGANLFPNFTPITNQFTGITVTHSRYFTTGVSNNLVGGFLTNDFSGAPDTLSIRFAAPIRDLSFVYHQIGTTRPSNFRAMLGNTVVDSFSHTGNQSSPNNYYGFTNILFDELQIDFVADFNLDTLAFNDPGAACTFRNGTGVNPAEYRCVTLPVLGTNWQTLVVTNPNTLAAYVAIGLAGPHPGLPLLGHELLIQPSPAPVMIPTSGTLSLAIPNGPSWNGLALSTQGMRVDLAGPTTRLVLLNALDIVLGL
ncbi:MAG: hypothetical protein IT457_16285 [Planctomycetes bacterium]|nr:hypothetical protein [Planctomycetota bacterium]